MVIRNMKKSRLFHSSALTHTICDAVHLYIFPQAKFWNRFIRLGHPCAPGCRAVAPRGKRSIPPDGSGSCQEAAFMLAEHQCTKCREVLVKGLILEGFACSKTAFTVHLLFNFLNSCIFLKVCFLQLDLLQLFFNICRWLLFMLALFFCSLMAQLKTALCKWESVHSWSRSQTQMDYNLTCCLK